MDVVGMSGRLPFEDTGSSTVLKAMTTSGINILKIISNINMSDLQRNHPHKQALDFSVFLW
jgi:hypothetical protein